MSAQPGTTVIYGWKQIAAKLRCSVRKAQQLSKLPVGECPPIYRDHKGVCAVEAKLEIWMDAQFIDIGTYRKLQRGRRLAKTSTVKRSKESGRDAA